jgi:potassium-dependent mechanosensitive channel
LTTESNLKKTNVVKSKTYLTILVLTLSALVPQAHAQLEGLLKESPAKGKTSEAPAIKISEQLEIWKKQVEEDLARIAKFTDEASLPPKISLSDLEHRKRNLERTQAIIKRHFDLIKEIEENKLGLEAVKKTTNEWNGYGEKPPESILVVDELINRKQAVIEKKSSDQSSRVIYERTLNEWIEESKKAEQRIIAAQKTYDAGGDQTHTALWNLESEKEKQRLLFIQSSALKHSITALEINIQTYNVESALLDKKIQEANQTAKLTKADIAKINEASSDRQKSLRAESEALRSRQNKATADEAKALAELEKIKAAGTPDPVAIELASITYEASQARVASIQQMIGSLESFSQIEALIPEAYQHRLVLLDPKSTSAERKESIASLQSLQQRLTAWEIISNNELKTITAAIGNEQARSTAFAADDPRLSALNRIRTTLWERQALIQRLTQSISTQIRTLDGWLSAYLTTNKTPLTEKVSDSFSQFWTSVNRVWNIPVNQYEQVIERDGQKIVQLRDVTLGSVITALVLFIFAYLVAANISRRIQLILVRRRIIGENQARTLRNWLMVLVGFLLALATLNWLNIPLTIFAFLAGALAIGVGFGTQTMIKNFISGIILLFERKVRVGDTIEVDGIVGVVSEINTRSSIIRSINGVENLIPNSLFLENRVVNWTLNNRLIRREIKLGVTYGSPTHDVIRILTEAAERHGLVLKHPEPVATLSNFGDNSMEFTLFFWIEQNDKTSAIVVESDLRVIIEKRLAEDGISVPFPQRDVHLEMSKPLQIEINPNISLK